MAAHHAAVAQLAALVAESTGNLVPAARLGFLAEVAERRARAAGLPNTAEYVRALAAGELPREWESLVPLVTIKESYFFRAPQQFEVIERQVLPRLLRARAASRRLRIWSAACARGEEPATLAMLLADQPQLADWDWSILATDLDEEALAGARRGLYGERAVALVPPPLLARCFSRCGKLFELAPELRSRIDYRSLNLAHPPFALPADEYDLILLRNVLIYFGRPLQTWVMAHVTRLLSRRGVLFLGASETLWQIQDELEAVDLGSCYCYRHRRARPAAAPAPSTPRPKAAAGEARPGSRPSRAAGSRPGGVAQPAAAGAPRRLPAADAADAAPSAGAAPRLQSAQEMLLAAARELAANRMDAARRAVDGALAADPSEPAGHLLDGFLHDLGGSAEEAAAAYRAALYLDPSLFQPRLLLADCLLRLGQRGRAEHQYREVLAALEAGRERSAAIFDGLPLPDRDRALRRCRQALQHR
jgi:chemotaxis protein methyltransferase CheR